MSRPVADVIEDLEFLNDSLVGATDAARRTDFPSAHAMEKWLERHGRTDLWQAFKHRDPAGAHPSGTDRKKRTMSIAPATHPLTALLDEAEESSVARHRRKAERIRTLIAELRTDLECDRERREAEERAREEVAELEKALAEAKAALRQAKGQGKVAPIAVGSGVSAADLRAWAARNGIACPATGRVPAKVREAFENAQQVAS